MANKKDPRLDLIEFVKPNGMTVMVNSFSASLAAAVAAGWVSKKEYAAVKVTAAKAVTAAKVVKAAKAGKRR